MTYDKRDVEIFRNQYDTLNVRTWPYYPIVMPLKDGKGPANDLECDQITFEVWDYVFNSYGTFEYLPDAINEALKLNMELLS